MVSHYLASNEKDQNLISQKDIQKIKKEVLQCLQSYSREIKLGTLKVRRKSDYSLITDYDLLVSNIIKNVLQDQIENGVCFFCEEDYGTLSFPCFILDPIDGTREFTHGNPDCSISLAYMHSPDILDPKNQGWIYNPFTGLEVGPNGDMDRAEYREEYGPPKLGLVSRTEWKKKVSDELTPTSHIILVPRGSIALKLALLYLGACDFIYTLTKKSIWDLAAGTILCYKRGLRLYQGQELVERFSLKEYASPLLWCRENERALYDKLIDETHHS